MKANPIKLLKGASQEANALTAFAIVAIFIKTIFLNEIITPFKGLYHAGVVFEAILASIIASYVFYIFVVHIKELSDRKTLRPYLEKHAKRIIGCCTSQLNDISRTTSENLDLASLSREGVQCALKKIHPYSDAPLLIGPQATENANWFQYFHFHEKRSKESIRKLFDQLPFLEAKLISSLSSIDDNSHFSGLSFVLDSKVSNTDLSVWSGSFYEYCVLCRELRTDLERLGYST